MLSWLDPGGSYTSTSMAVGSTTLSSSSTSNRVRIDYTTLGV
jgi:hypothetical protein